MTQTPMTETLAATVGAAPRGRLSFLRRQESGTTYEIRTTECPWRAKNAVPGRFRGQQRHRPRRAPLACHSCEGRNPEREPQATSREPLTRPQTPRFKGQVPRCKCRKADSPGFPALPMPVFMRKMPKLGESVKLPYLPRVAGPRNGL